MVANSLMVQGALFLVSAHSFKYSTHDVDFNVLTHVSVAGLLHYCLQYIVRKVNYDPISYTAICEFYVLKM